MPAICQAAMELSCSRCLEPAQARFRSRSISFFGEHDEEMFDEDEIELTEEDTRTAFFAGTQLAIGDILREQVLLALPMKALCRVDCKGLCPVCGTNLNLEHLQLFRRSFQSSYGEVARDQAQA